MKMFQLLASLLFAATALAEPTHQPKIATVDMMQLFEDYHRTAEMRKKVNTEFARVQKEDKERLARLQEVKNGLDTVWKQINDPAISDSRKMSLSKDFQTQKETGIALERERADTLGRKQQALKEMYIQQMKGLLEEIRKLVEQAAKMEDYDYVFDKSGLSSTQAPILLYSKDATDITASILRNLNKGAPPAVAENGAGKAPVSPVEASD